MSIFNYFSKTSGKDGDDAPPARGGNKVKESPQMYHDKFLAMPLEEKRKLYRCKDSFVTLDDIPLWPCLYKVEAPVIDKMIQSQKDVKDERSFKFKADKDIPKKPLPCVDAYNMKVSLWQGDITALEIDAVVNAANETLLGGGGVDGCIHRAAGESLRKECFFLDGARAGEAKLTCGHRLPAKYIIHTVGPRGKQPETLRSCYDNCFNILKEKGLRSVAFCCISTGIFGYPNRDAAHVALQATRNFLEQNHENFDRVIFCTFMANDFKIYQELMADKYFPCKPSPIESKVTTVGTAKGNMEEVSAPISASAGTDPLVAASPSDHPVSAGNNDVMTETATANAASPPERDTSEDGKKSDDRDMGNRGEPGETSSTNEFGDSEMNSQDLSQDIMDLGGNSQDVLAEPESQGSMELGSQPV